MAGDRRRSHWSDTRRTARARSEAGVPVEIDPELTPPPCEPPAPSSLPNYDSIPPPIREQLDMLAGSLGAQAQALTKIWDTRHLPEQLQRVEGKVDAYTQTAVRNQAMIEELLKPQLFQLAADQTTVERGLATLTTQIQAFLEHQWPTLMRLVEDLGERLQRVERKQDDFAHAIGQHDSRLSRVESALVAQDGRIKALELIRVEQTGASRERRHWITVAKAAVVAAAGAIGWLANHLF